MSEPFVGEIRIFGFNFAPAGWALCDGQLLSISQNTALFSLLGTTYGGNGTSTFALPDFRGRAPVNEGSNYVLGQTGGTETAALTLENLPIHSHVLNASTAAATTQTASGGTLAEPARSGPAMYTTSTPTDTMGATAIGTAGSGSPASFSTFQPTVVVNYCVALQGVFPPRS